MDPLDLTGLSGLMAETEGMPEIVIGLIDGPVAVKHPDLTHENLRTTPVRNSCCKDTGSLSCRHGTFVAGMLNAKRKSPAPGICPGCTLLIRPVFSEIEYSTGELPAATPAELAWAIVDCIEHNANVINMSIAIEESSAEGDRKLEEALNHAMKMGVIVVAAAGNQGTIGASALTRHPWSIPVAACDQRGKPSAYCNIAGSISRKGLRAPGEKITSLGSRGPSLRLCGTSTAVPFVTGAVALLWSAFPASNAWEIHAAITRSPSRRHRRFFPPLLNASAAYLAISSGRIRRYTRKAA